MARIAKAVKEELAAADIAGRAAGVFVARTKREKTAYDVGAADVQGAEAFARRALQAQHAQEMDDLRAHHAAELAEVRQRASNEGHTEASLKGFARGHRSAMEEVETNMRAAELARTTADKLAATLNEYIYTVVSAANTLRDKSDALAAQSAADLAGLRLTK